MKALMLIGALFVLLLGGEERSAPPGDEETTWSARAESPAREGVFVVVAQNADEPGEVHVVNRQPRAWLGIRGTPIPEALAAHVGARGVMVANVVAGSPADRAGIDQYDVVLSFNGVEIDSMQQLVDALSEAGAGTAANVEIRRAGERLTLTVTPEQRPADAAVEFKFEEPKSASMDDDVHYFGHRLSKDPQGNWMIEPLGNLQGMPDSVKDMLDSATDPAWNQWLDDAWSKMNDPVRMRLQVDPRDPAGGMMFFDPGDAADDASVRIDIDVSTGDSSVRIVRSPDGSVEVTRTDANGKASTDTYADLDALRAQDPDAYSTYRRYSGFRARPFVFVPPTMNRLPDLQLDFQRELQQRLDRLRERLDQTQGVTSRAKDMLRDLQQGAISGHSEHFHAESSTVENGEQSSLSITIENGHVTVVERTGDATQTYEFDSLDTLKQEEPALYEKVQPLLGGRN